MAAGSCAGPFAFFSSRAVQQPVLGHGVTGASFWVSTEAQRTLEKYLPWHTFIAPSGSCGVGCRLGLRVHFLWCAELVAHPVNGSAVGPDTGPAMRQLAQPADLVADWFLCLPHALLRAPVTEPTGGRLVVAHSVALVAPGAA